MTTVGYGDITPANDSERAYALGALLIGALVFGYMLSAIGDLIGSLDKGGAPCFDDHACNLNGACEGGACVCDRGWTGANCSALNLQPARARAGFRLANASSWGGSVLKEGGTYHMFVEELVGGCGLNTYARNMRIAHAVSESGRADGPSKKRPAQ